MEKDATLDCYGVQCPMPIIKTAMEMMKMEAGQVLEVVATDLASYGQFARNVLQALPGVRELHSSFSLMSIKARRRLPLPLA